MTSDAVPSRGRAGFTLVELLIGVIIMAVIGAALIKLIIVQSRAFEQSRERIGGRQVSRSAMNLVFSELRMVDAAGGVVTANRDSVTLRVPYAMGVLCVAGGSAVALLPTDSAVYAAAGFSGYAYRDSASGVYQYVEGGASLAAGSAVTCTGAGFNMPAQSRFITLAPPLPLTATAGTPVLLEQRITYAFAASVILPGRQALWRRVNATNTSQEVAMPFDTSRAFRFFVREGDSAQTAVPSPLSDIRGLELVFAGQSERKPRGRTQFFTEPLVTAVFFGNRP